MGNDDKEALRSAVEKYEQVRQENGVGSADRKDTSKESGSNKNKLEEMRRKQQEVARQTALQRQKSLLGESERENDWIKTNEADPKDVSHPDPSPAPSANSKVHS